MLPVAVDPLKAMQPGAPPVAEAGTEADTSEALAHSAVALASSETKPAKAVNISQQANVKRGDVAKGFAEADHILEKTYRVPMVHQGYLEPHAVLAQWDTTGNLTLWASTQGSFNTRSEVADVLEIAENRIKVIPVECGGGFGGKIRALCEPITAELARVTNRPVRYVMTRREELEAGMPAPQVIIRLKTGVKRDGTLLALEAETILDTGAFSGTVLAVSAVFLGSMYKWPAFDIKGMEVLTHKPSVAAYRAPGGAPDHLRHRVAHGADRPRAQPGSRRVPHAPPDPGRRPDGEQSALAEQRRQAGAGQGGRASDLEGRARSGRPAAARTARACAAPASLSAAGSGGYSPPAPLFG